MTFKNVIRNTIVSLLVPGLMSCESLFDSQGDCDPHYYIKFEFTMNMEYADAFKEQVQSVDLWIFDKNTGDFVDHIYTPVADLASTDYLLPLDVEPGEYNFVAWCGHTDNRHFTQNTAENIKHHTHATARLSKRGIETEPGSPNLGMATSNENLDLLFHGALNDAVLPTWEGLMEAKNADTMSALKCDYTWDRLAQQHKVVYTVPLIRDVNNITMTLEHISGPMDTDHKRITMVDNNGSMLHDNSLDESDEPIVFKPWDIKTGMLEGKPGGDPDGDWDYSGYSRAGIGDPSADSDFMKVELSTGRLMADHNPKITISDIETGNTIIEFPVTKWLLQLRSEKYGKMSDQEYLDRKFDHELYVVLQDDGRGGWMAVSVVINGWHVIDNGDMDF